MDVPHEETPGEPEGKRSRRRWPWIIWALVVVGIVAAVVVGTRDDPTSAPATAGSPTSDPVVATDKSIFGCEVTPDDLMEGVTTTDVPCTYRSIASYYCHVPIEQVSLVQLAVKTNWGGRSTLDFAGGQGGATLDLVLPKSTSSPGKTILTCMTGEHLPSRTFSQADWDQLLGPASEVTGSLDAIGSTVAAPTTTATTVPAPTTTDVPPPPLDDSGSAEALAAFDELKESACTEQPYASQIPPAVAADPPGATGNTVITDAEGNQLFFDRADGIVTSVDGPDGELPPPYTFGCDPEVFVGTSD